MEVPEGTEPGVEITSTLPTTDAAGTATGAEGDAMSSAMSYKYPPEGVEPRMLERFRTLSNYSTHVHVW